MAFLMDAIKSLAKNGLKKAAKKHHTKCSWDNSSSDSNRLHVDKHLKLDEPLALNLMSTEPRPIKVTSSAAKTISSEEKTIENAKTGKVTAGVAVMYLNGKSKVNLYVVNLQKKRDPNRRKKAIRAQQETDSLRKSIRVLRNTGSSGDLLFMRKGSTMCILVELEGLSQSHGVLPTAPFKPKKVGDVEISFVDYSDSKRIHLKPDIVEYAHDGSPWLYDLLLDKQTLHELGVVLDFKEKTITIDEILLPMRNINNLQLKPSISRALKSNTGSSQEPVST